MTVSILPSKIFFLLGAACLGWIALLSTAFVMLLGTGVSAGWIVGGALIAALAVWVAVMFQAMRNAPDQPEYFAPEDSDDDNFPAEDAPLSTGPISGFAKTRVTIIHRSGRAKITTAGRHSSLSYTTGFQRSAGPGAFKNRWSRNYCGRSVSR